MIDDAQSVVRAGVPDGPLTRRRVGFMRYHGQGHEIEVPLPDRALTEADIPALRNAFEVEYSRQFSRAVPGMTIEILNWAVEVSSQPSALRRVSDTATEQTAEAMGARRIMCDVTGVWREAAVYDRNGLLPGDRLAGPALIIEPQTTTFVSADFSARVDAAGNIWLHRQGETGNE
jgi:N-methylhydantoinase A